MTQTNKCQHDGEMKTGWDELTCKKCGWILPSGQRIGIHDGWFPSHDAHKEFKKYHTYTGMNEIYPIDLTKYAEIPNMTDLISREALLGAISTTWEEASPLSIIIIIANSPAVIPQSVADALEEAAKICDDNLMSWVDDEWNGAAKDCAKRIRALIKRNAVKEGE